MPLISHGHDWTSVPGGWKCQRDTCSAFVTDLSVSSSAPTSGANYLIHDFIDAVSITVNGV